ncbi:hypothetical protein [Sulfurovum sp.]|uniref:hypothetical protein n=1 Tax=Sulfurovum sp. TaxID=1969726 RepID=UPI002632F13C|nr:hypothetical protein [Sulfurovum sp.]
MSSKEQAMIIKVRADADKATAEIRKLNKEVTALEKQVSKGGAKKYAKSFDNVSTSAKSLTTSLKGVVAGMAALGIGMKAVEFTKMAADAEQAGDAFDKVVTGMGKNAEDEFNKIKEASKGLISDADMKQSATTALSLGVPLESLAKLMEVARVKSREMGTDVKSAFADLATGIGRGSPMILDNLGLTIKLGAANKKMAASLGKTVEELSKQEKTQALANAVIEAGTGAVERYADASLTNKESLQAMNAALDNLKVKLGTALLPIMRKATKAVTEWADSINNEDMKSFASGVDIVTSALGGVLEAAKMLNDVIIPDWIAGENAGLLDTSAKGWAELGNQISRAKTILDSMDSFAKVQGEISDLQSEMDNFDGGSDAYEKLSGKVMELYGTLQKLKLAFEKSGSKEAKAQLKSVDAAISELEKHIGEFSKKKPFDAFSKNAKEAADATKKYSKEQLSAIKKVNDERISSSQKMVGKLEKNEAKLTADIAKLHQKLASELKKIDEERFQSNIDTEQKIKDIGYSQLSDTEAYYAKQKDAAIALSKAKEALYSGELEKYKEYISQYEQLATESAGRAIEAEGKVLVSKEETARAGVAALRNIQQLENQYYNQKEQNAKAANDAAVAQKQVELDSIKAQLEAQKALIQASKELAEALSGKKVDIDTSVIDASIAKIDQLKQKAAEIGSQPPAPVRIDTQQIDSAHLKIEELKTLTLNGTELKVDADTTPADFGIKKLITKVDGDKITMEVNPEYDKAQKKIEDFRKKQSGKPIKAKVTADTKSVEKNMADLHKKASKPINTKLTVNPDTGKAFSEVKKLEQPTSSSHTVKPDARNAFATIAKLEQTTHSTHIIDVYEKKHFSGGGFVPQVKRLAVGGAFTGSGKVPGYDPTDSDKVNAKLTGGEFVINRRAVDAIGTGVLHRINAMQIKLPDIKKYATGGHVPFNIPSVPKYADGGQVNIASDTQALHPVTFNLGGNAISAQMTPEQVMDALSIGLERQGGL